MKKFKLYYINLDKRQDRNKEFLSTFERWKDLFELQRIPGIDKGGPYGCSLSHIHAVTKILKESKDDYILVCEDDAIPMTSFNRHHFEQVMKWAEENKGKWDIIHFGPSDVDGYSIVNPYLCKANICMATHFMCYSRSMIKVFEEWDDKLKGIGIPKVHLPYNAIDCFLSNRIDLKKFIPYPYMFMQRPSISSISGNFTDYTDLFKVSEKKIQSLYKK